MNDKDYMLRAIELAQRAIGHTSPNPMVGAVIVKGDGQIIGEGYHQCCGEAHAEVNAINSISDKTALRQSTIYVTLEPCSHWGKTPPCADLIIESGIKRVVIGCVDPFEKVSGRGISRLQDAGIEVIVGVCEGECRELNKRFITAQTLNRPYVILKWAQSSDGFIDIVRKPTTPSVWFTGDNAKKTVHTWRSQEDAIMVGRRTAELDNPSLTVRSVDGRNPLRVVIDRKNSLSKDLDLFDNKANTLIFSESVSDKINCETELIDYSQPIIDQILTALHKRGIHSLIVEGGTMLLNSFIDSDLWDEARIFTTTKPISHYYTQEVCQGVTSPKLPKMADYQHLMEQIEPDVRLDQFFRRKW